MQISGSNKADLSAGSGRRMSAIRASSNTISQFTGAVSITADQAQSALARGGPRSRSFDASQKRIWYLQANLTLKQGAALILGRIHESAGT